MECRPGLALPGAGHVQNRSRWDLIRDYMRTQGMDPDDPKNASRVSKDLKKSLGLWMQLSLPRREECKRLKMPVKVFTGIFDMMKKLGSLNEKFWPTWATSS